MQGEAVIRLSDALNDVTVRPPVSSPAVVTRSSTSGWPVNNPLVGISTTILRKNITLNVNFNTTFNSTPNNNWKSNHFTAKMFPAKKFWDFRRKKKFWKRQQIDSKCAKNCRRFRHNCYWLHCTGEACFETMHLIHALSSTPPHSPSFIHHSSFVRSFLLHYVFIVWWMKVTWRSRNEEFMRPSGAYCNALHRTLADCHANN